MPANQDVVIISACRTPVGKFQGNLSDFSATQLGAIVVREVVKRAGIDPATVDEGRVPGGDLSVAYFRLHGSPRTYYSSYEGASLDRIAQAIQGLPSSRVYCIFDNTALGHATGNAIEIARRARLTAQ